MGGKTGTSTRDINRVTRAIILISWKLILLALVILLVYESVSRGYQFGYGLFHNTAVDDPPGVDLRVTIGEDESLVNLAAAMEESGLAKDRFSFLIQCIFYEYGYRFMGYGNPIREGTYLLNTSMPAKEIIITLRDGKVEEPEESSEEE